MRKRFFWILTIALVLLCAAALADAPAGVWTDYAASDFAGGDGSKENPYLIATAEQLAKLAKEVNSGVWGQTHNNEWFVLADDIDLSAHRWIPIGRGPAHSSFQSFGGYFDGNDKTITGLYVDESQEGYSAGLFGNFTGYLMKDLTVSNAYVKTAFSDSGAQRDESAGILIGSATVGSSTSISVQNCHVSGTVETEGGRTCAGGLVGYASYADFMDCSADVTVRGSGKSGGFIGEAFEGTYKDCTAKGKVDGGWSVGGFAGILYYKTQVEKCAADCRVTANDWNVGGFVGYVEESVTIRNCVAFGDVNSTVTGWQPKAGGFAGTVDGSGGACTIQNSHAAGKVSVKHDSYPGYGFASVLSGDVTLENNSFDGQKNAALSAAEGEAAGVAKENTQKVLENICQDYYDGHDWDMEHWVVDKQPTTTENGYRSHHCKRCDMAGEAEILPMLDPTPVPTATPAPEPAAAAPRTGDTSPLLLWGALLLVSGAAMLWAGTRKKKA